MNLDQVKQAVETTPKGANIVLEWVRPVKTLKGVSDKITKSVRMIGRIGVEYDNLTAVQDKRESGELPSVNAGLPWGKWSVYPWLIEHKDTFYLRLYKGTSATVHPEVHFFRNGVEVALNEIAPYILASEKEEKHGDCFTCKTENITRIHSEYEWVSLVQGQVGQEKITVAVPTPAKVIATL